MHTILITVCILSVILLIYMCKTPYWQLSSYRLYHDMVLRFGKPNVLDSKPNGRAIWYPRHVPFSKIVVADTGGLFVSINIHIDAKHRSDVLAIPNTKIDNATQQLTVQTTSFDKALAMMSLAVDINKGEAVSYKKRMATASRDTKKNYRQIQSIKETFDYQDADII